MNWLSRIFKREETVPKYKMMQVEDEVQSLSSHIILNLEKTIEELKQENNRLRLKIEVLEGKIEFTPAPEPIITRRKITTPSELATILEAASIERKRKNDEKNNPKHSS